MNASGMNASNRLPSARKNQPKSESSRLDAINHKLIDINFKDDCLLVLILLWLFDLEVCHLSSTTHGCTSPFPSSRRRLLAITEARCNYSDANGDSPEFLFPRSFHRVNVSPRRFPGKTPGRRGFTDFLRDRSRRADGQRKP